VAQGGSPTTTSRCWRPWIAYLKLRAEGQPRTRYNSPVLGISLITIEGPAVNRLILNNARCQGGGRLSDPRRKNFRRRGRSHKVATRYRQQA